MTDPVIEWHASRPVTIADSVRLFLGEPRQSVALDALCARWVRTVERRATGQTGGDHPELAGAAAALHQYFADHPADFVSDRPSLEQNNAQAFGRGVAKYLAGQA